MPKIEEINLARFGPEQTNVLFRILVLQKLCPGRFLVKDPVVHEQLDKDEVQTVKDDLRRYMPLTTLVTDMWDWDIQFEELTFEDTYFDVALGPEEFALSQAEVLRDDILRWIDEYAMDYDQNENNQEEFSQLVLDECVTFIRLWRSNIVAAFT